MKKKLILISVLIICIAILSVIFLFYLNPVFSPTNFVGGTSFIYGIDANGHDDLRKRHLSEEAIKVLKKRIDPENKLRLAFQEAGDLLIEIRMPLPTSEVQKKLDVYKTAYEKLLNEKINPRKIEAISLLEEKQDAQKEFEKISNGSKTRLGIIKDFSKAYNDFLPFLGIYDENTGQFDPNYIKYMIKGTGILEFRVLPTTGNKKTDSNEIKQYIEQFHKTGPDNTPDTNYVWCEVKNVSEWLKSDSGGKISITVLDEEGNPALVEKFNNRYYLLASNKPDESMLRSSKTKWRLDKASETKDFAGRTAIFFVLDKSGGDMFSKITVSNIGRPLCILFDNIALSAPIIRSMISREGTITGNFSYREVMEITSRLNAGALPAKIIEPPISIKTIEEK